jgi:tetratricopeptide (TPR) repeat protein
MLSRLSACALLCAALMLWAARDAKAQDSPDAAASRALFDEARRLMAEGKNQEACLKLEESQKLRSGIGTQFNLAECYEKTGRLASAWALYQSVANETQALGQTEREAVARQRAAALEARLGRLTLEVSAPVDGLALELDGVTLHPDRWSAATPLDPGTHQVSASAPGHETWQGVAVIPDAAARVTLQVPALTPSARPKRPAPSVEPKAQRRASTPTDQPTRSVVARRMPYIVGGVGAAGVVIGGLFGLRAMSKNGEAEKICVDTPNECPDDQIQRHEELTAAARAARGAGYVTFGLGLVGLGLGAAWILNEDDDETASSRPWVLQTRVGASDVGAELTYGF